MCLKPPDIRAVKVAPRLLSVETSGEEMLRLPNGGLRVEWEFRWPGVGLDPLSGCSCMLLSLANSSAVSAKEGMEGLSGRVSGDPYMILGPSSNGMCPACGSCPTCSSKEVVLMLIGVEEEVEL